MPFPFGPQLKRNPYCPAGKSRTRSVDLAFPFSYGYLQATLIAGERSSKGLNREAEVSDECKKPSGSQDFFLITVFHHILI